jgi:hypothetical protein
LFVFIVGVSRKGKCKANYGSYRADNSDRSLTRSAANYPEPSSSSREAAPILFRVLFFTAYIINFQGAPDGSRPTSQRLAIDAQHTVYGTTATGGQFVLGTVFQITQR